MRKGKQRRMVVRGELDPYTIKTSTVNNISTKDSCYTKNGDQKMNQFFSTPTSKREEELEPLYDEDTGNFVLSHSPMADASKPTNYKNNIYKFENNGTILAPSLPFVNDLVQKTGSALVTQELCPSTITKLTISLPTNTSPKKPKKTSQRSNTRTKLKSSVGNNRQLTEFYPIRRSCRQTRSRLLKEKQNKLEEFIVAGKEEGVQAVQVIGKGRGVITTRSFKKGEFVVEYAGELISVVEAKRREMLYSTDQNTGCYMYYFIHNNRWYCVDATAESDRLGRLINHSRNGNLVTKSFDLGGIPHLILVAKHDIDVGEELLYDYGDRSKTSLESHPWLAT